MRLILGRYLKIQAWTLKIDIGRIRQTLFRGCRKPRKACGSTFRIRIEMALIAISRDREVGVDVEYMRPNFVTDEVATISFRLRKPKSFALVP